MSEQDKSTQYQGDLTREQLMDALFANLMMQQANMALMFLGKVPNPQTGKETVDLEAAQLFIDNLEMLEVKTKGNLSQDEEKLLKQSLMNVRMTFVDVANKTPDPAKTEESNGAASSTAETSGEAASSTGDKAKEGSPIDPPSKGDDDEERRKFVKKY